MTDDRRHSGAGRGSIADGTRNPATFASSKRTPWVPDRRFAASGMTKTRRFSNSGKFNGSRRAGGAQRIPSFASPAVAQLALQFLFALFQRRLLVRHRHAQLALVRIVFALHVRADLGLRRRQAIVLHFG